MAKDKQLIIQRGYARGPSDEKRLRDKGVKTIYRADKGETLDKFKMRAGELLGVVEGYRAFGDAKGAMIAAERRIHGAGAAIIDVETELRSDRNGAEMMAVSIGVLRPSEEYREMQAKAVEARHKRNGRMPEAKARAIWFNPKIKRLEAADLMGKGWSPASAYRAFGKRDVPRRVI